jgi:hypothetical protein
MSVGIYCYRDSLKDNTIVYIGKDTYIHRNKRHKEHHNPSLYDAQQINRVLQNNHDRYSYEVLKEWNMEEYHPKTASLLEKLYIRRYNPKFNYTLGGDGLCGFKFSEESKKKISESLTGKTHSLETRKKMSESHTNKHPTIHKSGFNKDGKQVYVLRHNGKILKYSIFLEKLEKELDLLNNEVN